MNACCLHCCQCCLWQSSMVECCNVLPRCCLKRSVCQVALSSAAAMYTGRSKVNLHTAQTRRCIVDPHLHGWQDRTDLLRKISNGLQTSVAPLTCLSKQRSQRSLCDSRAPRTSKFIQVHGTAGLRQCAGCAEPHIETIPTKSSPRAGLKGPLG